MKIAIETLGCKLNQAETETLARQFVAAGYTLVQKPAEADVYILNTCTVTQHADAKARHMLRMAHRANHGLYIIVTGCYAERAAAELQQIEGVNLVINNTEKTNLPEILQKLPVTTIGAKDKALQQALLRTRSFIKIQDGCQNFCSYCIVPYVRALETSVAPDMIINDIKQRTAEGVQEIILTGTRVGGYKYQGTNLTDLLARILNETDIPRIRLSSLQPQEITPALIELWRNDHLCPHFHLSLQSGSAAVLKRMNRRYTPADFLKTVELIRSVVPSVGITTDIIVGFPGETDAEFTESLEFCRKLGFARIHVFSYSPRSGTAAAKMPGKVSETVKKARSQQVLALAEESAAQFLAQFSGENMDVLWERQNEEGEWSGTTGNYIRVHAKTKTDLHNKIMKSKMK
jgi:threonylcarbamoyladenosine tRNA methylthiotransferase MtaB